MPKLLEAMPSFDVDVDTDLESLNRELMFLAETLDDFERTRIALDNRIRAWNDKKEILLSLMSMAENIAKLEHEAERELRKVMRSHPLGGFVKRTVGLGDKQVARLLAAIGDPAERVMVSQLWQFCGHGDPERSRRKRGEQCSYSPTAKMRVRMIAESCMKQMHSPYRAVYDRERAKWEDRETSDLHKHNHALRVVGKEILRDLWVESRS